MDRQNRQTWIAATAVILTVVGTTWWTGRRMISDLIDGPPGKV